jgi:hypothetical protein
MRRNPWRESFSKKKMKRLETKKIKKTDQERMRRNPWSEEPSRGEQEPEGLSSLCKFVRV